MSACIVSPMNSVGGAASRAHGGSCGGSTSRREAIHNNINNGQRIPSTLQAVFLVSNRGKDVNKPPPERVADKVFFRNWFFTGKSNSNDSLWSRISGRSGAASASASAANNSSYNHHGGKSIKNLPPIPMVHINSNTAEEHNQPQLKKSNRLPKLSPQQYLDAMIRQRGYSTTTYKTLNCAYYNKPTQLQRASYDVYLIDLVKKGDIDTFQQIVQTGISTNPCNQFGESIIHLICRLSRNDFLQIMIQAGCQIQVTDDYGRTPLHDTCWAANVDFDLVKVILDTDVHLFYMADCRGALPLSYVRKEHWAAWIEFLESVKDVYWPLQQGNSNKDKVAAQPPLTLQPPCSRPIPDPVNALTPELATMVVSGKMKPSEVLYLNQTKGSMNKEHDDEDYDSETDDEEEDFSDDDDEYDSDSDDDDSSFDSEFEDEMEEMEMANLLGSLRLPVTATRSKKT